MASSLSMRIWTGAVLALAVASLGVWQALRPSYGGQDGEQALMAIAIAIAAGCYRLLPSLGLALVWLVSAFQVERDIDITLVQLAVVFVAYGTARYGRPATVWLSAISIPTGSALALWYVHAHGSAALQVLGLAIVPSGQPRRSTALLVAFIVLAGPWAVGLLLRVTAQTRQAREERERATAEAARAQEVATLRAEQNQLARDVHDVVGHSLAVILAQADSAQYMDDDELERIRSALANISNSARRSLGDVREVLSTSGDGETRTARHPGSLDGLIDGVRSAGYDVDSEVVGAPRPLPPDLDSVAFRVLQEMLTNALKHGRRDSAAITVRRAWDDDEVRIEVENEIGGDNAAPDGDGLGLSGMRRRLEAVGGTLTAGPQPATVDRPASFVAAARLPVRDRVPKR